MGRCCGFSRKIVQARGSGTEVREVAAPVTDRAGTSFLWRLSVPLRCGLTLLCTGSLKEELCWLVQLSAAGTTCTPACLAGGLATRARLLPAALPGLLIPKSPFADRCAVFGRWLQSSLLWLEGGYFTWVLHSFWGQYLLSLPRDFSLKTAPLAWS